MKKITSLFALLFVVAMGYAQDPVIDRFPDNTTGLISTLGDDGTGVYCADYFVLDEETTLGEATFFGLASTPGMSIFVEGFNVFIYENGGSSPAGNPEDFGTGVLELSEIDPADYTLFEDGQYVDFTLSFTQANGGNQVTLPAGEYWIDVFPNVIGGPADAGRWNWFGSISSTPAYEPMLIDPADLFGEGATDWVAISGLIGEAFPSFAWNMSNEPKVSVGDNIAEMVSIYPNPTTDVFNIQLPASVEVISSSLVDVTGRTTGIEYNNGQMNVSGLAQGVYFLNLETSHGSLTQKVVKQ